MSVGVPRAAEQRKLVSVLFADVVGSTAFGSENDPEAVRSVMSAYFERMRAIAEGYGGTVEKFIGDAVMVVFGIPRLHDDDAERAVRAGLEMRRAMADLNRELGVSLAARIGVNSGEAVAGGAREGQFLVTGDAVNMAARLQQGAEAGEVVVGALTESLTRAAITYEARVAIGAKGKAEPLVAFRAIAARSAVPDQARGLPAMRAQLVGREREMRLLLDTFARVRTERRAHLFTVVGNAGIGKSRLVGEALARIATGGGAHVLLGRCLPYGAGITYWPLIEIVRDDAGIADDDLRDAAVEKLGHRVETLLPTEAAAVRQGLIAMLGLRPLDEALPGVQPADVAREIAWAVREYTAALARDPTVLVVDGLQWAEPALLEILEGIAERAEDASLLLLCIARPDLLEARPTWAAGRANAATITLDALAPEETRILISRLLDVNDLPEELRARVVVRSEGNPLFCEEFLRMLIDEGHVEQAEGRWRATARAAEVRVPESIHALLAARIDGLGDEEKRALQVASIVGERFSASEIAALVPDLDVARALRGLRRSGLVLEDRETRERERYRFKHLLVRDVAYAGLPKAARADLHEEFARELERQVGDRRQEFVEILGHHVQRAFALSSEVRAPRGVIGQRARNALRLALELGERARRRQDLGLLRPQAEAARDAVAALGDDATDDERIRLALLGAEERRLSYDYRAAINRFDEAIQLSEAAGRAALSAQAHLGAAAALAFSFTDSAEMAAFERHAAEAGRLFREAGDRGGEVEAGIVALEIHHNRGELGELVRRGMDLAERARSIGDEVRELLICARLVPAARTDGLEEVAHRYEDRAEELIARLGARVPRWLRVSRCRRLRQEGDIEGAIACYRTIEEAAGVERDDQVLVNLYRHIGEMLAMERRAYMDALSYIERGLELSALLGETFSRAELTGTRAVCLASRGEFERAREVHLEAERVAARGDVFAVMYLAFCRARIAELAGDSAAAANGYSDAARRFGETGFARHFWRGISLIDRAQLLLAKGDLAEAQASLAAAEGILGQQTGERAERIAQLRERVGAPAVGS